MNKNEILNLLYTGEKSNINEAFKQANLINFDLNEYFGLEEWTKFKISKYKLFGSTKLDLSSGLIDGKPLLPYIKKLQHLDILSLYDKQITHIEPGTFANMPNLTFLQFGGWGKNDCIVELLPETFKGLANLKILHLYRNKTKRLFPHAFAGLDNLKELNLSQNNIEVLESGTFWGLNKLVDLSINKNNIQKLKNDAFIGLESLSDLYIVDNDLKELEPECFRGLPNLKSLTLSTLPIDNIPKDVFKELGNLEVLKLGNCPNLKSINTDFLQHTPKLKNINIWNTGLSNEQVSTLEAMITM